MTENYPDLKANANFLKLQKRISRIENEIADRRELYNDSIMIYNTRIQSFPDLIISKILNFTKKELFKATEQEKKNLKLSF